jgi:cobalt/nickel transport system permease protein
MGIMAAFIFAAQMINFPVAGGTSGHLLGGALAAIVLGPWAGMLVMVTVVSVQALIFQDGGLVVMGANIFNMGVLTTLVGYGLFRGAANRGQKTQLTIAGLAAWISVVAGALLTAFQLWLSGTSPLRIVFPAMLSVHVLIGIGEAFITVAAIAFIFQTRPDILSGAKTQGGRGWMNLNFIESGASAPFQILPDYTIPLLGESGISTIFAGIIGVLLVSGLMMFFFWLIRQPKQGKS